MITPIGSGKDTFWNALIAGVSGVDNVACIDTSEYKVHKGCEVKNFDYSTYINNGVQKKIGKGSQFAIAAAKLALTDAKLDLGKINLERIGVSVGTTAGEIQILERVNHIRHKEGEDKVDPDLFLMHPCNNIPANIAIEFGLKGPNTIIPTACAAGNYAIGYAYDLIKFGRVDMMLAGGSDPFSKVAYTGFARLGAIAPDICQPFDKNRKGMMVGEGAGMLLLESLDHAMQRNAHIYAEIIGYGLSCDAYHITNPCPGCFIVVPACKKALKR